MRLSTKGRYGLKIMHYLAKNSQNGPVALSTVANDLNLPISYLEQLVRKLKKANLVKSLRGAYGGYSLAKEPAEITVGEVLRTLEQYMTAAECLEVGHICPDESICAVRVVWNRIQDGINKAVDEYTLKDLLDDEDKLIKK